MIQRKTDKRTVRGTVIKKNLSGGDMLVVEVDMKKYPFKRYKWGKWNFKISNMRYFEHVVEGSLVEGDLFDYIEYSNGSPTRIHLTKVLRY